MTYQLCVLAIVLNVAPLIAQSGAPRNGNNLPPPPRSYTLRARFKFDSVASRGLRDLWQLSLTEQRERVACLGTVLTRDTVFVTRVLLLEPGRADSLGVSAQPSIDTCGPPDWQGTVHTHIAHLDDGSPYDRFSGADRGVMQLWWRKWRVDGAFCVLYTEMEAYCEVNGATGIRLPRRGAY